MDYYVEGLKELFPNGTRVKVEYPGDDLKFVGTVMGVVWEESWPGKLIIKFESSDDELTKEAFAEFGYETCVIHYYRSMIKGRENVVNVTKLENVGPSRLPIVTRSHSRS